ncbi:MAG: hypothetical protein IPM55_22940 [Acidobacteria bacterium]|nr:hypothetical protein [Acidobacteriota bacterium]
MKLSYASEAAANAEQLASASRYDEAGQAMGVTGHPANGGDHARCV